MESTFQSNLCPNCGYCPCCGRNNQRFIQPLPDYPWFVRDYPGVTVPSYTAGSDTNTDFTLTGATIRGLKDE